jgi:hypothetical protein
MKRMQFLVITFSVGFLFFMPLKASAQKSWFKAGQNADILLSGIGFNKTGGKLLFNHPMNIATDGTRLLLADTRNNRILIWNKIPDGNVRPDIVLGQNNFLTNNPGSTLNRLNWPVGVATAQGKVVVSDTYNHRILIWNTFPTANAQPADLYLDYNNNANPKERIEWPWGVWTDGSKLIVTSTVARVVLIYNSFPTYSNQWADLYLEGKNPDDGTNRFGTPRTIGTDGKSFLVIGDHNAQGESAESGSFFWNSFPSTDNEPYDFFMANPVDEHQMMWGGVKASNGKFITVAAPGIAVWNSVPKSVVAPDLFVGRSGGPCDETGYYFNDGDGSGLALTPTGKLFVSLYNSNKIVAFNSLPSSPTQCPDFAVGAPGIDTNTLDTNCIITNGIPATDGSSLLVSSDFDKKLYVWRAIPSKSGTHPDAVYDLDFPPWDNALHNDSFVIAGFQTIQVWTENLPLYENKPDITLDRRIGPVSFQDIRGVALDDNYLYVADNGAGKLYVWNALPDSDSSPLFTLALKGVTRLSSDGRYLTAVFTNDNKVQIYDVANLSRSSLPVAEISKISDQTDYYSFINLPQGALVAENHLFIADTNLSRVFCWESIDNAISGAFPDVILGKKDYSDVYPRIGINSLFWPAGLAFHRNRLWVGEFKFSGRLVGFKYQVEGRFIESNPTFGDFDRVAVGSNSIKTFTISNQGTENLKIKTITIAGTNKSQFSIQNDNCSGKTIKPKATSKFKVIFSPTSAGQKSATVKIPSNDPSVPTLYVPISGIGIIPTAPTVSTGSATSVASNSVTLNGSVNPQGQSTEYFFEYGTSMNYGSNTERMDAGSGMSNVSVSAQLTGLIPNTTYYFRIVAQNSAGTSYGEKKNFKTL